jgi:hypothetical protein
MMDLLVDVCHSAVWGTVTVGAGYLVVKKITAGVCILRIGLRVVKIRFCARVAKWRANLAAHQKLPNHAVVVIPVLQVPVVAEPEKLRVPVVAEPEKLQMPAVVEPEKLQMPAVVVLPVHSAKHPSVQSPVFKRRVSQRVKKH